MDDRLEQVKAGYQAVLIVAQGNPAEHIKALECIQVYLADVSVHQS